MLSIELKCPKFQIDDYIPPQLSQPHQGLLVREEVAEKVRLALKALVVIVDVARPTSPQTLSV